MTKNTIRTVSSKKIKTVGLIFDQDDFSNSEKLIEKLHKMNFQIQTLVFKKKWEKEMHSKHMQCDYNDLDLFGNIKNETINKFVKTNFDLLISFYKNENEILKYFSALNNSDLKTGFTNNPYNQLMLEVNPNQETLFVQELHKNLTFLNKI